MATKTAILAVKIITDATAGKAGLDSYATGIDKVSAATGRLAGPSAIALGAVVGLAAVAGKAASELEQASGAVESVYGVHAAETKALADQAAVNVGLAKSEYSNLSAVLGAQLKNMGIDESKLVDQTDDLITMGADLAATFGGTTADAVAALSSLMRGERDPIEKYGVSIKAADVEAQKAAMGLSGLEGEAARAADTQATLALLTKQTADATGQFARESGTAAGSAQIAKASFEDASAALGAQLLPLLADGARLLSEFATWATANSEAVTIFAGVIAVFAGGILAANGAIEAYRTIMVIATAAQWLYNAALTANPIGLVIVAIGLLIAIIVLLVTNWEEVGRIAEDVWGGIVGWIEDAVDAAKRFFGIGPGLGEITGGGSGGVDLAGTPRLAFADADPTAFGATGGWPTWAAGLGSSSAAPAAGDTYNITIQGAVDREGTARQIRSILNGSGRLQGTVAAAGGRVL